MVDQPLPAELTRWLANANWTVLHTERVVGGFAALAIYRITVQKPENTRLSLVYKQLAPGRLSEWRIYDTLSPALAGYMPHLFAKIEETSGRGLLLENVGVPLKHVLAGGTLAEQYRLVLQAVSWLTTMHLQFSECSSTWLQNRLLGSYPVSSSLTWAEEALERVEWAADVGIAGLTRDDVRDVKRCARWFYPNLETWMRGPATVTHGDPHLDNLLIRASTFKLTDWEFTCVTIPQRDLAILVQDVLQDDMREAAFQRFCHTLRNAGWAVDEPVFQVGWLACFFDNTLMMLGWEVFKFRHGHLSRQELEVIVPAKLRWLQQTFSELRRLAL